jgi:hypothetical protein
LKRSIGEFVGQEFEGSMTRKLEVFRFIYHTHPTAADPDQHLVVSSAHPDPRLGCIERRSERVLYVIGGYASSVVNDTVQAYHPTTNTWRTEANMPTALGETAAVVDNGVIYVMGGGVVNGNRANNVEMLQPATNTWTVLAPLLEGKSELSSGLLGKTIVAADGYTNSGDNADNEVSRL